MSDAESTPALGPELGPDEVQALREAGAALLIDVRQGYERDAARIADDRHVEMTELTARADSIPRDRTVVFYCRSGNRSGMAAEAFRAAGWDAHNLAGGMIAWIDRGLPTVPEDGKIAEQRPV